VVPIVFSEKPNQQPQTNVIRLIAAITADVATNIRARLVEPSSAMAPGKRQNI